MQLIAIILLTLLPHPIFAGERLQRHEHAAKEIKQLNFFKNGRGMTLTPNTVLLYDTFQAIFGKQKLDPYDLLHQRWGVNIQEKAVVGLHSIPYKDMQVGVLGCVVCHSGKAAGKYIIGLGNKNIDVGQMADDAYYIQKFLQISVPDPLKGPEYKELEKSSLAFAHRLSNPKTSNLTQGLVPTSMIRWWFYNIQNMPLPLELPRGTAKVAHFWGYSEKRKVGQFCDGFGDGNLPGWGIAVELSATQTVENVRSYIHDVEKAEDLIGDLLPPKYPFQINTQMAQAGKKLFSQNCMGCHGSYERDKQGHPIYQKPKWIPIHKVQTDADRLAGNTDEFKQLVSSSPLNDVIAYNNYGDGYFAPRLDGIWARFPYLHNASVPTLMDLLSHPSKRPVVFSLKDAGEKYRFDPTFLGLTYPHRGTQDYDELLKKAKKGRRSIYYTKRAGQSNQGHYFSKFEKLSYTDKKKIIEYLKTL